MSEAIPLAPRPAPGHGPLRTPYRIERSDLCINCGECERVCPVDIPLMTLNRFLARQVRDRFDYQAGYDVEDYQPLASWKPDDNEDFIL